MPAKVQIVLPSFNRPKHVQIAIRSVLNQTFTDWKLYIMDNSSPNLWPTMQQIYSQYSDSRIKIDRTEVPNEDREKFTAPGCCSWNWTAVVANKALFTELSEKEPYVVLTADDDYMMPNKLEVLASFLDNHPEASMVSGVMEIISSDGIVTRSHGGVNYKSATENIDWVQPMYRRGLLDKIGTIPTEDPATIDVVLFNLVAELTDCCYGIPIVLDRHPAFTYGKAAGAWRGRALKGEVME